MLQAFVAGGFANGVTATNVDLAIGEEVVYTVRTPADATSLDALFPALSIAGGSGNLNVWMTATASGADSGLSHTVGFRSRQ